MVKASGQIEKELGLLQQRTEDMENALDSLYRGYLKALGEASKQQLMSAVYYLCTQAYPDKFLALSWKQRNQLQTELQTLAKQIDVQLSEQRSQAKKASRQPSKNNSLAFLQRLLEARASGAVIHTQEGNSDDLLEKLSEIARFESQSKRSSKDRPSLSEATTHHLDDPAVDTAADETTDKIAEDSSDQFTVEKHDAEQLADSQNLEMQDFEVSEFDFEAIDSEFASALEMDSSNEHNSSDGIDSSVADTSASFKGSNPEDGNDSLGFEDDVPAAEQRLTISEEEDLLGALEALARNSASEETTEATALPLSPVHLIKQQALMDKAIRDVFKAISDEINTLLQKANVMPHFPQALMAAAVDSHGVGEPVNAVPNVVKVSIRVIHGEANFDMDEDLDRKRKGRGKRDDALGQPRVHKLGNPRRNKNQSDSRQNSRRDLPRRDRNDDRRNNGRDRLKEISSSRRLLPADMVEIDAFPEFAVINLQLSEVEFADPRVSVWRGRLRKELSHLKQLNSRYKQTQKSLETAQAQDAWRSSWTATEET